MYKIHRRWEGARSLENSRYFEEKQSFKDKPSICMVCWRTTHLLAKIRPTIVCHPLHIHEENYYYNRLKPSNYYVQEFVDDNTLFINTAHKARIYDFICFTLQRHFLFTISPFSGFTAMQWYSNLNFYGIGTKKSMYMLIFHSFKVKNILNLRPWSYSLFMQCSVARMRSNQSLDRSSLIENKVQNISNFLENCASIFFEIFEIFMLSIYLLIIHK